MKIDDTGKQIKIDDDFFKMPEEQWKPKEINGENGTVEKIKHLLPILMPIVFILIIIIGAATIFLRMQISVINDNLIYLNKTVSNIDTASLKSEMTAMETKIERLNKENEKLKSEMAHLGNEIEAIKARKEKTDTSAQKQPAAKKKAVNKTPGKNPRMR
jgi:sensor histidine kinase YesM